MTMRPTKQVKRASQTQSPGSCQSAPAPAAASARTNGGPLRGRLLMAHVSRENASAQLAKLGSDLDTLATRGYSPTRITGVGDRLFVLVEHESVLSRRLFRPMAQFFNLLHQYEESEEPADESTEPVDAPQVPQASEPTQPESTDNV